MQPETGTEPAGSCEAAKQPTSSPSVAASRPPATVHRPVLVSTVLQNSKWPVSSEKATFWLCAAQGTRVCSLDVAYIGWKAYGVSLQVVALGWKFTCVNPLAMLAVMEPVFPEFRSTRDTSKPAGVSNWLTRITSPDRMKRSWLGSGVKVASVWLSGPAGACECPFFVTNAKLTGSTPAWLRQAELFSAPLFWSSERLSTFSAAHHCVTAQLLPAGHWAQPGG